MVRIFLYMYRLSNSVELLYFKIIEFTLNGININEQ